MTYPDAIAQRSQQKLYFNHPDMDYYLSWIMGRQVYDGSTPEECLEVAARIIEGDPTSWQQEWVNLAQRVADQAQVALSSGNPAIARHAYLRACTYYRAPLFIMNPAQPNFEQYWRQMQECFRQAAALFDPPIEAIQVPFQEKQLAGYLWQGDTHSQKRPTLIVIGGIETFAEDCYFMIGSAGLRRGYTVMTVDLPGQGINPMQGLFLRAKMDIPIKAVVDYALTRPEVDPDRLALFGFSWGGHIALKGAQHEPRLKALIANPATHDMFGSALAQQTRHSRGDRVSKQVFDQIAWRFGLKLTDIPRRLATAVEFLSFARANCRKIQCPTLCMAGAGEAQITLKQARNCFQQLPHPQKQLAVLTQAEGGEAHCQINNLSLLEQVIFDWLDPVLGLR